MAKNRNMVAVVLDNGEVLRLHMTVDELMKQMYVYMNHNMRIASIKPIAQARHGINTDRIVYMYDYTEVRDGE